MIKPRKPIRCSRITVGRLYNLGNYEHVRYELTVDVPAGNRASIALRNTVRVLAAANPKPPVSIHEVARAKSQLDDPQQWHKGVSPKKERQRMIREMIKEALAKVKLYETWQKQRAKAMELLDRMGAAVEQKDAKLTWEDDSDQWG